MRPEKESEDPNASNPTVDCQRVGILSGCDRRPMRAASLRCLPSTMCRRQPLRVSHGLQSTCGLCSRGTARTAVSRDGTRCVRTTIRHGTADRLQRRVPTRGTRSTGDSLQHRDGTAAGAVQCDGDGSANPTSHRNLDRMPPRLRGPGSISNGDGAARRASARISNGLPASASSRRENDLRGPGPLGNAADSDASSLPTGDGLQSVWRRRGELLPGSVSAAVLSRVGAKHRAAPGRVHLLPHGDRSGTVRVLGHSVSSGATAVHGPRLPDGG